MFCPNTNDPEYQALASVVGEAKAHTIWNMNNGNPVSRNTDGTPSLIYQSLVERYGQTKAILYKSKMFSNEFLELNRGVLSVKDSIDEHGNVSLNNGIPFNLVPQPSNERAVTRFKLKSEFLNTSRKMKSVNDNLNRVLPGVSIISESFNTTKGTPYSKMRGWVDKDGLHINTDSFHYSTPVHELSHIWIHVLEHTNIERYNQFMRVVEASVSDNTDLYNSIKDKYPHLDKKQLMYEYAATVAGFVSEDAIQKYMNRNSLVPSSNKVKALYNRFVDVIKTLFNTVKQVFTGNNIDKIDFSKASLNDMFMALTQDYIEGNNILGMSYDEVQVFMDKYYSGNMEAQQANDRDIKKIRNINQLTAALINNDDMAISGDNQFENEEYVNNFAKEIESNLNKNSSGDYFYYVFSKRYDFSKDLTYEQRINKIKEDIIPFYAKMVNSFNDNIVEVINRSLRDRLKPIETHISEVFESFKMSEYKLFEIKKALDTLGINEPIYRVLNYSQLKDDPSLKHLYKPILEGYNPLIIIHKQTDDSIDMSIIDLASGILGRQDNILSSYQLNLASRFGGSDKDFSYGNSKSDIRKILVATTLAGMNKMAIDNNMSLKVRKSGVIGFQGRTVSPHLIRSLDDAFNNARRLYKMADVDMLFDQDNIDYNFFRQLVDDDAAWTEKTIIQPWRNKLQSYYETYYAAHGLTAEQRDAFTNEIGTWAHYDVLEHRKREIEHKKEKTWIDDPEHKIITQYLLYFKRHMSIHNSQVIDIDRTFSKVTNIHNVKSDILQVFSIEAEAAKAEFINKLNGYKDKFVELLEKSLESHGKKIRLLGNVPEKMYEHLFKTGKVHIQHDSKTHKKGDVIEVKLFNQLYGSYNLAEAKAAGLTTEDIALADYILATVRERYIALKMHENEFLSNKKTKAEIEVEIDAILVKGSIPVLPATDNEFMRKGRVMDAISKKINKVAKGEYLAGDYIGDDYKAVHSLFAGQIDFNQQLKNIGLRKGKDGSYVEIDMNKYEDSTMNLEYLFNMFVLDNVRKITIEKKVIPAYNTALQYMQILDKEYGYDQKNTKEYLDQYYERVVERKNRDPKTKLAAATRTVISLYSFASLGLRPTVWMRSAYYNTQNQILTSLATAAANLQTPEENRLDFPTPSDMSKANALMITDFQKIYEIGKKFSIINSSEIEAIESVFTTVTDRNIFKQQVAHIGNYYSDVAARLVTMVAFMVHDGSYDAHIFDKQNGKLSYDVTKDKRFYNDGVWKNEDAKRIHNDILEAQRRQEGLVIDGKQVVGYDFEEANTRFKWYVDKYLIGSMDEYQKILLGNTYTGQLFTQFRTYLPDKAFNWFGSRRTTMYGGTRKVEITEDEQVEVIKQQILNEGSFSSMWHLIKDIVDVSRMNGFSFKQMFEVINNNDPMAKMNINMQMFRAVFGVTILLGLKLAFDKGLSDRDRKKLEFLYGNLLLWQEWESLQASAMPITGLIDNIMSLITGEANWKRITLRYTGPVNDVIWYYELFTNTDQVIPDARARKKVRDMNEKEKERYNEKRALEQLKNQEENI